MDWVQESCVSVSCASYSDLKFEHRVREESLERLELRGRREFRVAYGKRVKSCVREESGAIICESPRKAGRNVLDDRDDLRGLWIWRWMWKYENRGDNRERREVRARVAVLITPFCI